MVSKQIMMKGNLRKRRESNNVISRKIKKKYLQIIDGIMEYFHIIIYRRNLQKICCAILSCVLREYIRYYNTARPHQGIDQKTPIPFAHSMITGTIARRKILGGIINDYYQSPFPVLPA